MLTGLISGLTSAMFAIVGKLMTKKFFEELLTKLIIKLLRHISKLTINTMDDEFVEDIVEQLKKKTS